MSSNNRFLVKEGVDLEIGMKLIRNGLIDSRLTYYTAGKSCLHVFQTWELNCLAGPEPATSNDVGADLVTRL